VPYYSLGDYLLKVNSVCQLENFEQAVLEIRTCIDFFGKDYDNIYIIGTSLGAIISIITMAQDKRVKKGVFINLGGDFSKIVWYGMGLKEFRIRHLKENVTLSKCKNTRAYFSEFLAKVKKCNNIEEIWKIELPGERCYPESGFNIPSECYYADPLTFAKFVKDRSLFLINSAFDQTIRYASKKMIINELERPLTLWLPCDHISIGVLRELVMRKTVSYLRFR